MNVLAVATCLEPGSLALLVGDAPSTTPARPSGEPEVVSLPPGWRSVALHEEIRQLLARHDLTTSNVDLYAVTAGPGAFTGVRLGLTAVKGLAEVHEKPVLPVSTLEVLAFSAVLNPSRGRKGAGVVTTFAPVLDARRGQMFAALYATEETGKPEATELRPLIPDSVCSLPSFLNRIKEAGVIPEKLRFCVTDETILLPAIEAFGWTAESLIRVSPQLAGTLARMAAARFRPGKGTGALAAEANYVRASDAELFWKE